MNVLKPLRISTLGKVVLVSVLACSGPPGLTTEALVDGYVGVVYSQDIGLRGGAPPITWSANNGSLPPGLALSASGQIAGTPTAEGTFSFQVSVSDADQRSDQKPLSIAVYRLPAITSTTLTGATEGVTYLRGSGIPELVTASGGKPPLIFSASGLPGGIALDPSTGLLAGVPAQMTAGDYMVTLTATDQNGWAATVNLVLQVRAPRPISGGGTASVGPAGSALTDTLTVFTQDSLGNNRPNMAVRLRKNGVEFSPVKEQLTDANGKTVFTGLGLNGATDTVDITASGPGATNASWQRVNAAVVTIPMSDYPIPAPRSYAAGGFDPISGKLVVHGGSDSPAQCRDDLLSLANPAAPAWSEDVPPGMWPTPVSTYAGMAYAGGAHVLFGGYTCSSSGDTNAIWLYNASTNAWTRPTVTGPAPSPRQQMAVASVSGEIVVFGGLSGGAPVNDVYVYNVASATWRAPNPAGSRPAARYNAGVTAVGSQVYVCGGNSGTAALQDCWIYNVPGNSWTQTASMPSAREGFGMAAGAQGKIYVFGGKSGAVDRNDLIALSGGTWSAQTSTNPPPARHGALFAFQSSTSTFLLFGGQTSTDTFFSDVWTYNPTGGAWTQRAQSYRQPGYTLSGTITGGVTSTRARFRVQVTGTSGYVSRPDSLTLTDGLGTWSYRATGIPPGDTIAVTVLNEDQTRPIGPSREWSYIDLGVVNSNVTADFTVNIPMPPGPMSSQLVSVTAPYVLPSDWLREAILTALPRVYRPGFSTAQLAPNGTQVFSPVGTFRSDYFPPGPGTQEVLLVSGISETAQACENATTYTYVTAPGPLPAVTLPPGLRSLSPGLSQCVLQGTGLFRSSDIIDGANASVGEVAVADLSGDGIADLVMVNGNQVAIFYGDLPSPTFYYYTSSTTLSLTGGNGGALAVADFDRNGKLDIAVGVGAAGAVAVSLQSLGGTFGTPNNVSAGSNVRALAAADVNGDGVLDLVTTGNSPGNVITSLRGNGNGTFAPYVSFSSAQAVTGLASADLNRDGFADVVYGLPGALGFHRGSATGLQASTPLTGTGTPASIATGDMDNDGVVDVVSANQSPNGIQVWLNTTSGGSASLTFTPRTPYPLTSAPSSLKVAELTGDTRKDVVFLQGPVVELQGTGGGALGAFFTGSPTPIAQSMAVGDLNLEGATDVLVAETDPAGGPAWLGWYFGLRPIPPGADVYSFTVPPNARLVRLSRRPVGGSGQDFDLVVRAAPGPMTVTLPELSTLLPGRTSPARQYVAWTPNVYISTDPGYTLDHWQASRNQVDTVVTTNTLYYVR